MKKILVIAGCFFLCGILWGVLSAGQPFGFLAPKEDQGRKGLYQVGDEMISQFDIKVDYRILTKDMDAEAVQNEVLEEQLIKALLERRVLATYIRQDKKFQENPDIQRRFEQAFSEALEENGEILADHGDRALYKQSLYEKELIKEYFEQRRAATAREFTGAEIEAYYAAHESAFYLPALVTFRHILVGSERRARQVRAKLTTRNFTKLAREHSLSAEAKEDGILGPVSGYMVPDLFPIAYSMKKGRISDIIQTTHGFHIILLLSKTDKRKLALDEAKAQIIKALEEKRIADEYQNWLSLALQVIPVRVL